MGVYCGVCASRLGSASENDGWFSVDASFDNGWELSKADYSGKRQAVISNTCEDCGKILRHAVAAAASKIAAKHTESITKLKADMERWEEDNRRAEQKRIAFENAWAAEQARKARGGK